MEDATASLNHTWTVEQEPAEDAVEALRARLAAENVARARMDEGRNLAVFVHEAPDRLVGGIAGWVWGQCLEIDYLWVHEDLRGQGYGRGLVHALEGEARARGCRWAVVDTYSFQAPEFYQKLGYEVLGMVDGYPREYQKLFLKKDLSHTGS